LAAPHHLATFDFSQGGGPILMLFPFLFLARPFPSSVWRILIFCALQISISILTLHSAGMFRYTLISVALLSCLAGAGIGVFLEQASPFLRNALKAMVLIPLVWPHLAFAAGGALKRKAYALGRISREEYLQKFYDQEGYDTVIFCNKNLSKDAKI